MTTAIWANKEFHVLSMNENWSNAAGVYIFCGVNLSGQWVPLYMGKTESFQSRLPNHDRWAEAVQLGATHVHARVVENQFERDRLEEQLIQVFQPRLNTQLR
jgi:excinuclease UvrABC nuclease subunit